jgi:hypothetical protein
MPITNIFIVPTAAYTARRAVLFLQAEFSIMLPDMSEFFRGEVKPRSSFELLEKRLGFPAE